MEDVEENNGVTVYLYDGKRLVNADMLAKANYTIRNMRVYLPSIPCCDFDVVHALLTGCDVGPVSRSAIQLVNRMGISRVNKQIDIYDTMYRRDKYPVNSTTGKPDLSEKIGDIWDDKQHLHEMITSWFKVRLWILGGRILHCETLE
jgi:hypothetical protein